MPKITLDKKSYTCNDESLLDALLRQGKEIPFSCRNGVCHVCMMKVTKGTPNKESQKGISERLVNKGYFLPCKCQPTENLSIEPPDNLDLNCQAIVQEKYSLADGIWCFMLEPSIEVIYHAGQFINIKNKKGLLRSYSLASVPHQDYFLELHINRHSKGQVSRWMIDEVQVGDEIELILPVGLNYYQADTQSNLLLAATGTGLSPLIGIARDALYSGHLGEIYLYHGASNEAGLYLHNKLLDLQTEFNHFHYQPCLIQEKTILQAIKSNHTDLKGWTVHLAGNPDMVSDIEKNMIQLGVSENKIFLDPFTLKPIVQAESEKTETEQHNAHPEETVYPEPALDIWEALEKGNKLKLILDDFYDAVFEDPIMSPYFHNSTKRRSKEKVYSFYRRLFSGERVYFGDRPRNAHHWMVITDEIYDYRKKLLKSFMLKHNLSDEIINKWLTLEEIYRPDIVKNKARGRMVGNAESPAEGYGNIELTVGGMCDSCFNEIDSGTTVNYHLRTGKVYCPSCFEAE